MDAVRGVLRHPAVTGGLGTIVGYGIILTILTIALVLIPYLAFRVL